MILFGESAVRKAAAEFMAHYHSERNHQGLDNALIGSLPEGSRSTATAAGSSSRTL
jgi:hypothetical protein